VTKEVHYLVLKLFPVSNSAVVAPAGPEATTSLIAASTTASATVVVPQRLQPATVQAPSASNPNFLEKIETIKAKFSAEGWTSEKQNATTVKFTKATGNFVVTKDKITTFSQDPDTHTAMLVMFQRSFEGRSPMPIPLVSMRL